MNALLAVQLLGELLRQANGLQTMLAQAQAEGRDITEAELDHWASVDDQARARLEAAIARLTT